METKKAFMQFAEKIKSLGYRVFVNEKHLYAYVVNDKDEYGQVELSDFGFPRLKRSTRNVPNSYNGCGFSLDGGRFGDGLTLEQVTKEKIDEIYQYVPSRFRNCMVPSKITFTEYMNTDAYWVHKEGLKEI